MLYEVITVALHVLSGGSDSIAIALEMEQTEVQHCRMVVPVHGPNAYTSYVEANDSFDGFLVRSVW